eukprot:gene1619-1768_t
MATLNVYIASVTSSQKIRKEQEKIEMVLGGKKIAHQMIDIASVDGAKDTMRANSGDPKMLPPQFFLGEKYLGNFEAFELAIEDEKLDVFLAGN